jgi:hypothetical protein
MKDYSMYTYYKGSDTFPNKKAEFWGTYEKIFDINYSGKDEDKEEAFKDYISNLIYEQTSDSMSMGSGVTFEMIHEQYRKDIKHYFNVSDDIERYEL